MKVLHLMAGLGEASGVANIARRFARVQAERGDSAILLAPAFKWNPIYFGLLFAIRAWWKARTADEIWVHCSWTFPVWYGAWLAKLFGKKLVVVPEGSCDPKRLHNHAGWKKRLVAPLDRWVLRQADEVLALCKDEIEWTEGFEPSAKMRFERVPLFLNDEFLQPPLTPHSSTSPLHVLFLGRVEDPLKGVRFLERAVRELGEVGVSPERSELRSRRYAGCRSRTVELRIVSDHFGEELEKDWAWCDVLCLPTLSDNFGLVVAEALERGKKVITTDGASAWAPPEAVQSKSKSGVEQWRDRLLYLKGFRDGTDEKRVELLKNAIRSLI